MKNKDLIASNLKETRSELKRVINDLMEDPDYSEVELKIALEHAYHHLNFAWHIRNIDETRTAKCSDDDFKKWSTYPAGEITEYE